MEWKQRLAKSLHAGKLRVRSFFWLWCASPELPSSASAHTAAIASWRTLPKSLLSSCLSARFCLQSRPKVGSKRALRRLTAKGREVKMAYTEMLPHGEACSLEVFLVEFGVKQLPAIPCNHARSTSFNNSDSSPLYKNSCDNPL